MNIFSRRGSASWLILAVALGLEIATAAEPKPTPEQIEFFEKKVRPVLINRCYTCHSADTQPHGELRVDDRNGLLTGGDSGPAVVAGHPEQSLLLQRVRSQDPKHRMPKEGEPLSEAQIADLTTWIKDGVAWPAEDIPKSIGRPAPFYDRLRARHWAWQPLTDPKVPLVAEASWPSGDIDRFVLAKLEEKKLHPVADADRTKLIRRVTFDLTGLPPTPGDVDAFLKDKSKGAYAKVVDRLLQSPRFGERWGRHWLDVARYAESSGPSRNVPYPHAWRYRDYVIDSVNRDVPFDRFIQEQVAGDLLSAASTPEHDRLLMATGFLALGAKDVNQRFKVRFLMDNIDEQIDTVTRSVLALTVSCARCHDHKFDPIPATDYYALAGIFASTDDCVGVRSKMGGDGLDYYDPKMLLSLASDAPPPPAEKVQKLEAEVAAAKKEYDDIEGTPEGLALGPNGKPNEEAIRTRHQKLLADLLALTDPAERGLGVHGAREGAVIADTAVRIRGEAERIGPTVPRGFLTAFTIPDTPTIKPGHSGRLELAQWLTSPRNPQTPRVIVNRVWQHLFGQGIVATVDNFGVTGDRPSHPELLDHLASQFIRDEWSIKRLVRTIVLSRAYRLSSEAPESYKEIDPANRLVWRHSPRRLDAEEIRDAMLASAGRLQLNPPSGSAAQELKMIEMADNGPEARKIIEQADGSVYRSVYLPLLRGITPKSLEAFDPVSQTLVTGQRDSTTVPTQALYLLNSAFVRRQSLALADRLLAEPDRRPASHIRQAYLLILGRTPTKKEVARAGKFLAEYAAAFSNLPPAQLPPPVKPKADAAENPADPVDQNDLDHAIQAVVDDAAQPKSPNAAVWMSFVQALYASAEFRFVR
jgi:hypothetical protein